MEKTNKDNFHIILLRPSENLNIGSVARAMKNLGYRNLHLVDPPDYQERRAAITACWATDILNRIVIHKSLEDALSGMQEVVGFSARTSQDRMSGKDFLEWTAGSDFNDGRQIGLLFGPEDNGLSNADLALCRYILEIPADQNYAAFNLSQAVLLALWEISRQVKISVTQKPEVEMPDGNHFFQLDNLVENVAKNSGFYRNGTPVPVPLIIKNLVRRMVPNKREMQILLGLFGRIDRSLSTDVSEEIVNKEPSPE